jgi:hypothetical protein
MSETALESAQQINKAWSTIKTDLALDREAGKQRRSPWKQPQVPPALQASINTVTFRVYNCGPIPQTFMGARILSPAFARNKSGQVVRTGRYGPALEVHETEVHSENTGEYRIQNTYTSGEQFASDVLAPAGDPECDLRPWGCFMTQFEEGTPEFEKHVEAAYALLHGKYSELIQRADALWDTNDFQKRKEITDIYRTAAREMGVEREWCHTLKAKKSCDACGKPMDVSAIKCPHSDCGVIYDWVRARKFRLCSKAQYDEAVAEGLVADAPVEAVAGAKKPKVK